MQTIYYFQKGFNYSQDGPGNRLVIHLSGCALECPWCANPEGKPYRVGNKAEVEELIREAVSCKPMFFDGGGVTLTGGEATDQFEAVKALFAGLKTEGISTCLETNGTHKRLEELFPLVDYLIMDIKHYDDDAHRRVIGASNRVILDNIQKAQTQRQQLALRIPMIGGFNASAEDAHGFGKLLSGTRATVELLRYHEYGKIKYEQMGIPYTMTEAAFITQDVYRTFADILKQYNISLITT